MTPNELFYCSRALTEEIEFNYFHDNAEFRIFKHRLFGKTETQIFLIHGKYFMHDFELFEKIKSQNHLWGIFEGKCQKNRNKLRIEVRKSLQLG